MRIKNILLRTLSNHEYTNTPRRDHVSWKSGRVNASVSLLHATPVATNPGEQNTLCDYFNVYIHPDCTSMLPYLVSFLKSDLMFF